MAAVDVELDRDAVALDVGLLQIEAEAIGEAKRADAEQRFDGVRNDFARWAEVGVAPFGQFTGLARDDFGGGAFVPGFAQRLGAAIGRRSAFEADQRVFEWDEFFLERFEHGFGGDARQVLEEPFEPALGRGRDLAILQQRDGAGHEAGVGAGFGTGDVVLQAGAQVGDLLGDLGFGETELQRAAIFGLRGRERAAPLPVAGVDYQVGGTSAVEDLGGAEARPAKRRIVDAGESLEPAVDDVVAELAANVLLAERLGVGTVERGAGARDRDLLG